MYPFQITAVSVLAQWTGPTGWRSAGPSVDHVPGDIIAV